MTAATLAQSAGAAIAMTWWASALWGIFGGLGIEAWEFYCVVRRSGQVPWRRAGEATFWPFAASVLIRGGLGGGLAWAAAATGQISGPVGALAIGVAAPFVFEQLSNARLPRQDDVYGTNPEALLARAPKQRPPRPPKKAQSRSHHDD